MVEVTDKIPLTMTTYSKFKRVMDSLDVGESFAIAAEEKQVARFCAWRHFHRRDTKTGEPITSKVFTVKVDPEDDRNYRCWRAE